MAGTDVAWESTDRSRDADAFLFDRQSRLLRYGLHDYSNHLRELLERSGN